MLGSVPLSWGLMHSFSHHTLKVQALDLNKRIEIDGHANESPWKNTRAFTLMTHGGANFNNGSTPITLRAMQNGAEFYLHVEWEDDSESLRHLPLVKGNKGWVIKQNGFHEFVALFLCEEWFSW